MTATARDVRLHLPAGSVARDGYAVAVTPEDAGWGWSGLHVLELGPGQEHRLSTGDREVVVLPLRGSCTVDVDGESYALQGRPDVFSAVSDCLYVPRDAEVVIRSAGGGRVALPSARCERRLPVAYAPAEQVPVEVRGAGSCTRQVNGFAAARTDGALDADALIAVEVLTPAGNWSSYPPHKHDEDRPGEESELEEVYYYEVAEGPSGTPGVAYHRTYSTDAGRPGGSVDTLVEVRSGDVVLVPHGWHGPAMAAPGYDLYYLNVMARPSSARGDRAWLIRDDPAHAWVRGTWAEQEPDPRVPLTRAAATPQEEAR